VLVRSLEIQAEPFMRKNICSSTAKTSMLLASTHRQMDKIERTLMYKYLSKSMLH
jgi:hypothetical protein